MPVLLFLPCGIPDPAQPLALNPQLDPAQPGAQKGRFKEQLGQIYQLWSRESCVPWLSHSSCCLASLFCPYCVFYTGSNCSGEYPGRRGVCDTHQGQSCAHTGQDTADSMGTEPGSVALCRAHRDCCCSCGTPRAPGGCPWPCLSSHLLLPALSRITWHRHPWTRGSDIPWHRISPRRTD